ncbi:putative reverse transcriptase domain-containing protein [Tanacetum coccineum]
MLRDGIREVISPFKCTTLNDLLSRARVREADLLRKKNKEVKEVQEERKDMSLESNKVVIVSKVYRDVEIEIDDSYFKIDLIRIMLGLFDIVIGMDWLDKYDANILCSQKLVRVVNPQGRDIIIYGDRRKGDLKLCSVMKTRKYLSRGCYAFIAHVIDTKFEKKRVEDVPTVNEFLDVFPEDFPGIPPERQVEF